MQTITGTYAGRAWSLSALGSSSTLIRSTGTYAVNEYMKLKFQATFEFTLVGGGTVHYTSRPSDLDWGNFFTNSLTKSYTVAKAATLCYSEEEGRYFNEFLPSGTRFSKCKYTLRLDSNTVGTMTLDF